MTIQPLVNSITSKQIDRFIKNPSHALLLYGDQGSGKKFLSRYIANQVLGGDNISHKICTITRPKDKTEILIDQIRKLSKDLTLKNIGGKGIHRVVIIEDANKMGHEAQNALLKTLEEAQSSYLLILTVPSPRSVLPTIASRCQTIEIKPVSRQQSLEYFNSRYTETQISSSYALSGGQMGLMTALLDKDDSHPLKSAISTAKEYIRLNQFQRGVLLTKISDKDKFSEFLTALQKVNKALMSGKSLDKPNFQKLAKSRRLILEIQKGIQAGTNLKTSILRLLVGS